MIYIEHYFGDSQQQKGGGELGKKTRIQYITKPWVSLSFFPPVSLSQPRNAHQGTEIDPLVRTQGRRKGTSNTEEI